MKSILFIFSLFIIISCNTAPKGTPTVFDSSQYKVESLTDDVSVATKLSPEGFLAEKGYILNGNRTGQWLTFNKDGKIIESVNYIKDAKFGNLLKYKSSTGNLEMTAEYINDVLNGESTVYEGRRIKEVFNYKNDKLNGLYTLYYGSGKKQKEIEFVDGVQDGSMRFYDEEGNLTMEYVYKNGEKVSGGMVE